MNKYFETNPIFNGEHDFYIMCGENGEDNEFAFLERYESIEAALKCNANKMISQPHLGMPGGFTKYTIHVVNDKFGYIMKGKTEKFYYKWHSHWYETPTIERTIKDRNLDYLKIMIDAISNGNENVRLSKRTGLPMFTITFPIYADINDEKTYISRENSYLSKDDKIAKFQMEYAGLI